MTNKNSNSNPPDEKDAIIERLFQENSQHNRQVQEAKFELSAIKAIDGMSFLGAIKTLIKMYIEKEKEVRAVQEKLNVFLNKK